MSKNKYISRYERKHKRRSNNLQIFIFGGLAAIVFIVLLLVLSSDDQESDKEVANNESNEIEVVKNNSQDESMHKDNNDETNPKNDKEANENGQEEKKVDHYLDRETYAENIKLQALTTTDQNVKEAYTADWPAIGTKQKGKHIVTYEDGSDDRIEIKKAISYLTGLEEDNIIEHWVGNGGDQKVIATVSDKAMKNYYKIYLSWVKEQGWKPTKLEYLKGAENKQGKEAPQENIENKAEEKIEHIVENEEG